MAFPVPDVWTIQGTLLKSGVVFGAGKVYVYNKTGSSWVQIAETGINEDGSFVATFSKWSFQNGDESIEFPELQIKVLDYSNNLLWESNTYYEPLENLNIGPIDISKTANENGDCRVFGSVINEQGDFLVGQEITAFCLYFTKEQNETGQFKKIILGKAISNNYGSYEIRYNSTLLPQGLLLDSKENFGKNKVSLYAQINRANAPPIIETLVFNGKREQEISFTLKSKQQTFACEFERLHALLHPYLAAIFLEYQNNNDIASQVKAIDLFLKSNTTFPLVAKRENIEETKVSAYFYAHRLFFQLTEKLSEIEDENFWLESFFALAYYERITSLTNVLQKSPTVIQQLFRKNCWVLRPMGLFALLIHLNFWNFGKIFYTIATQLPIAAKRFLSTFCFRSI